MAALAAAMHRHVGGGFGTGARTEAGTGARGASAGASAYDGSDGAVPVLEVLSGLVPQGLRRGEAVSVTTREGTPDFLTLALLAGALRAGLWCAAVGVSGTAGLGGIALADLLGEKGSGGGGEGKGVGEGEGGEHRRGGLERLLLVPSPGERWAEIAAVLADGVDLLLVRPPAEVPAQLVRRLDARLRQGRATAGGSRHSAALVVLGTWPSARLTLRTARTVWTGLDGVGPTAGTGQVTGGQATVVAEGRATAGRPRTVRLWLPSATGAATSLIDGRRSGSDDLAAAPDFAPAARRLAAVSSAPAPAPAPAAA